MQCRNTRITQLAQGGIRVACQTVAALRRNPRHKFAFQRCPPEGRILPSVGESMSRSGGASTLQGWSNMKSFDETERPTELLRKLEEHQITYSELVVESGGLAVAAYRIARARCRTGSVPSTVPTLRELAAAATEILNHATLTGFVPDATILASECEQLGLIVIPPLNRRVA